MLVTSGASVDSSSGSVDVSTPDSLVGSGDVAVSTGASQNSAAGSFVVSVGNGAHGGQVSVTAGLATGSG